MAENWHMKNIQWNPSPDKLTEMKKTWDEYDTRHALCPSCGGDNIERTYVGFGAYVDDFPVKCESCKWSGQMRSLTPRKGER